jgi:TRAP-type C4-dicarboxylate transport system permease small subunit
LPVDYFLTSVLLLIGEDRGGRRDMERVLGHFEKWSTHVAVLSIFIMMVLTTADAIGRYLFSFPLVGAYEITEKYLMIIAVYLGASYTYRGGSTIRITLLVDRLPRGVKMVLHVFAQVFSLCYSFFLIVPAVQAVLRVYEQRITLSSPQLPLWLPYTAIPIGLLLMSLFMLRDLPRVRAGRSALFREGGASDVMPEDTSGEAGASK